MRVTTDKLILLPRLAALLPVALRSVRDCGVEQQQPLRGDTHGHHPTDGHPALGSAYLRRARFGTPSYRHLRRHRSPPAAGYRCAMQILLALRRPGLLIHYTDTVELLLRRGHDVELAFQRFLDDEEAVSLRELTARHPQLVTSIVPGRDPADIWRGVARLARLAGDYARYLHPRYRGAPLLRARVVERLARELDPDEERRTRELDPLRPRPRRLHAMFKIVFALEGRSSAALAAATIRMTSLVEAAVPVSDSVRAWLGERRPDVVVVAPLLDWRSEQVELVKAARALGIPCAVSIASWDNLSSKGLLRPVPDRVFVWNEIQVGEAETMHRVPRERVVATGAQRFDPWFAMTPTRTPKALRTAAGLPSNVPYVLYLCSSSFIAADERAFVTRWLVSLRAADDPRLASLGVLVRPHPKNLVAWRDDPLDDPYATIWPLSPGSMTDHDSRAAFYDSVAHSTAVVGINTSALIEAAVVGKRVLTLADGTFVGQSGTIHYQYLCAANGGFLHEARTMEEHLEQLRDTLDRPGPDPAAEAFVARFVRPHGLDRPATPILADAIEAATVAPLTRARPSLPALALRAALGGALVTRRWLISVPATLTEWRHQQRRGQRRLSRRLRKQARHLAKRRAQVERTVRRGWRVVVARANHRVRPVALNIGGGAEFVAWRWLNLEAARGPCNPTPFMLSPDCAFPLSDARLPLVYSSHCLEHLDDPTVSRVLAESHRVLQPGGLLVLKLPDFDRVLEAWRSSDEEFLAAEKWGLRRLVDTWPLNGVSDILDHRASMIFCGYWNEAYGDHFRGRARRLPGAYHGPAPVSLETLERLKRCTSPHEIAARLRSAVTEHDSGAVFNHQNAWGRRELALLLEGAGFAAITTETGEVLRRCGGIPGIATAESISAYCLAHKPQ